MFILKIDTNKLGLESEASERGVIVKLLSDAANLVGAGRAPEPLRYGDFEVGSYDMKAHDRQAEYKKAYEDAAARADKAESDLKVALDRIGALEAENAALKTPANP